jgi:hypothetical protein
LHETHLDGEVEAALDKTFWTGGFKHELTAMWAWCTKDVPMPIDDSISYDIISDVTTVKPKEGVYRRIKVDLQDNCMHASFDNGGGLSSNLCNAKSVNLACESVDKLTADFLVNKGNYSEIIFFKCMLPTARQ